MDHGKDQKDIHLRTKTFVIPRPRYSVRAQDTEPKIKFACPEGQPVLPHLFLRYLSNTYLGMVRTANQQLNSRALKCMWVATSSDVNIVGMELCNQESMWNACSGCLTIVACSVGRHIPTQTCCCSYSHLCSESWLRVRHQSNCALPGCYQKRRVGSRKQT